MFIIGILDSSFLWTIVWFISENYFQSSLGLFKPLNGLVLLNWSLIYLRWLNIPEFRLNYLCPIFQAVDVVFDLKMTINSVFFVFLKKNSKNIYLNPGLKY